MFGSSECHYPVAIVSREGTLVEHSVTGSNKDAPLSVLAGTPKKGCRGLVVKLLDQWVQEKCERVCKMEMCRRGRAQEFVHHIQENGIYNGIKGRCAKTVWRVGQAAGFSVSGAKHGLGKAVDGFVG